LESISQFILEIKDGFEVYSKNVVKMTKVVKTNEKVVTSLEPESDEEEEFSDNLSDYISEQINEMKDQKQKEKKLWKQLKRKSVRHEDGINL
jgi:hypothetical protein